ncbi:KRAB-A domain-containing protein 2-like [Gigantopelta aegis]|uniref:KRAB-A domain-containing protein 2-like n=1 Tax=Gigantopelta aegis TaxID=1735272 RepID=UPI001B887E95|nr:KRAB-A domain-containing protein 2-like [Gigantopelta aegis]
MDQLKKISVDPRKKTHHEYYLMSKFEILQCGDVEKLVKKSQTDEDTPLYYVSIEDTFDVIKRAHMSTGHGGRDRMLKELSKKYVNATREAIELFKSLCMNCQWKRKRPTTKGVVVQPFLTKEFSSRSQVDLVDMQSLPSEKYKWIIVYQDHLTKFCILRPLTSKRASDVAYQLTDIFLMFGAPHVLQSDNGSEFAAAVVNELIELWTELVIVHRKPRHPQSQGSVERENSDIKDMLVAWMSENDTRDWTEEFKLQCWHQAITVFRSLWDGGVCWIDITCPPTRSLTSCHPTRSLTSCRPNPSLTSCRPTPSLPRYRPTPSLTSCHPNPSLTSCRPTPSLTSCRHYFSFSHFA